MCVGEFMETDLYPTRCNRFEGSFQVVSTSPRLHRVGWIDGLRRNDYRRRHKAANNSRYERLSCAIQPIAMGGFEPHGLIHPTEEGRYPEALHPTVLRKNYNFCSPQSGMSLRRCRGEKMEVVPPLQTPMKGQ